jgi:predicted negative regulator of RcsB-dependent stress response
MKTFSDYWRPALAVQLLTTMLIGLSAWMNWQAYEQRRMLGFQVRQFAERIASVEQQLLARTKLLGQPTQGQSCR